MAKSLDDRIAAAMGNGARAATVQELITELETTIMAERAALAKQEAISISATAGEDEADAAAEQAGKTARRITRLSGKSDALDARLNELLSSERRKAVSAEWDAARVERDELAAELTDRWPQLQDEMIRLLYRLKASDDRCSKVNSGRAFGLEYLGSAENEARGRVGLGYHPTMTGLNMPSLKELRFPHFHSRDWDAASNLAWPPRELGNIPTAGIAQMYAEMEAAHRRRQAQ